MQKNIIPINTTFNLFIIIDQSITSIFHQTTIAIRIQIQIQTIQIQTDFHIVFTYRIVMLFRIKTNIFYSVSMLLCTQRHIHNIILSSHHIKSTTTVHLWQECSINRHQIEVIIYYKHHISIISNIKSKSKKYHIYH